MTTIVWDQIGDRLYQGGVDRGVLYLLDGTSVPWNGLIAVSSHINTTVEPVYFDGIKVNDTVNIGDFVGSLRAYTYPDEFLQCEGVIEDDDGIFLTGQTQKPFHLSWRTRIANDVLGTDLGYKLHLLRNAVALPSQAEYETLSLDSEPVEFEWSITAIPEAVDLFRPTAYLIIDSRRVDSGLLADIEETLYGDVSNDPEFPTFNTLMDLV